jgi:CBS domain-containing protein
MQKVADCMTKSAVSVASGTSLLEAVELMRTHRMGSLLVMDNDALVGIFTERDLLNKVDLRDHEKLSSMKVASMMTKEVLTVDGDEPYARVMQLMRHKSLRHLPVVKDGAVVGIISLRDLLDTYQSQLEKLLEEEKKFKAIINEASDGIVICGTDWSITDCNALPATI